MTTCRTCAAEIEPCDCGAATLHWAEADFGDVWCGPPWQRRRHEPEPAVEAEVAP